MQGQAVPRNDQKHMTTSDDPTDSTVNFPTADYYKHFEDQRDHVLSRLTMYAGAVDRIPYTERIMDFSEEKPKIVEELIDVPQAIERFYLELTSNAADNVDRSRRLGIDVGSIDITVNRKTVQVKNGGCPIPIEPSNYKDKNGQQMWVPELIFGTLLSSSTYDPALERNGAAVNGLGAKITNILSNRFKVHIGNANQKLQYVQTWEDHMHPAKRSEPEITPYPTGKSFVLISYDLDFEYFHYPPPAEGTNDESAKPTADPTPDAPSPPSPIDQGGYTDNMIALFARHAADISFTAKCPVTFNGISFSYQNILNYSELYFGEKIKTAIIHYEWPAGTETEVKRGQVVAKNPKVVPLVELCCLDTPDNGVSVSFVNGMITREGGVHVNSAFKCVSSNILDKINTSIEKQRKKSKSKTAQDQRKRPTLTIADVKPHISMMLACRLPNPLYVSQSKTSLSSPTPKIQIPEKVLGLVDRWDLIERLYAAVEAKEFKNIAKTDGKKSRHIANMKADDANEAGGKNSKDCVLYIVEGESAKGYPINMMASIPNARDYIGILPIRGKLLNVMNAPQIQIAENKEILEIKEILGLREGLDYTIDMNQQTLRYGKLIILCDSDRDALHIIGLIMNFIYCKYPSLLTIGFVYFLRTPILRIDKGKQKKNFYSLNEYDTWKQGVGNESRSWNHKYCKGLGSSSALEVRDDGSDPHFVACLYDDTCPQAFRLAFDDKLSNLRKEWIANHKSIPGIEEMRMLPISKFLYHEFVEFAVVNVHRSIPKVMDGLKEVQRKILWAVLKEWGSGSDKGKTSRKWDKKILTGNVKRMKVVTLIGEVIKGCGYLYGDKPLEGAIVGMAQDFVGTNNMPFLAREGSFGDRNDGKAAAARYVFTKPEWWLPLIFRNEDMALLQQVEDEGELFEPEFFLPILPLVLINGALGIGTGHSTFVPCHNPIDIVAWLFAKIRGEPLPDVLPWYRDFKGEIRVEIRLRKPLSDENGETLDDMNPDIPYEIVSQTPETPETETPLAAKLRSTTSALTTSTDPLGPDDLFVDETVDEDVIPVESNLPDSNKIQKIVMVVDGKFHMKNNTAIVEEVPWNMYFNDYKNWLMTLIEDKTIEDYRSLCTPNSAYFEVVGMKNPTLTKLRLTRSFGLTNMCLLNMTGIKGRPQKYKSTLDILEYFYEQRLPYYDMRRQNIINSIEAKIKKMNLRMQFIRAVLDDKIVIFRRKKADIIAQVESLGLPKELGTEVNSYHYSEEDIAKLKNDIEQLEQEKILMVNTKPSQLWLNDLEEFLTGYVKYYDEMHETPENHVEASGAAGGAASSAKKGRKTGARGGKGGTRGKRGTGRGKK